MTSLVNTDLIIDDLVILDLQATDKDDATRQLVARLAATGRATDAEGFLADVRKREEQMATGLPGGIGIPHARSAFITTPSLGFGRLTNGVDFGAEDGPATLVFLIAAPDGGGDDHLKILAALARKLMRSEFLDSLRNAETPQDIVRIINREVAGK
jgi:fructose-specific phosphotransferase system IIA component